MHEGIYVAKKNGFYKLAVADRAGDLCYVTRITYDNSRKVTDERTLVSRRVYPHVCSKKNTKLRVLTGHKRAKYRSTKLRIRFAILQCIKSQINFMDEKAARKRSGRINDVTIAFDLA